MRNRKRIVKEGDLFVLFRNILHGKFLKLQRRDWALQRAAFIEEFPMPHILWVSFLPECMAQPSPERLPCKLLRRTDGEVRQGNIGMRDA